ncbi:MAG: hypothetical protein RMK15_04600 [Chloroflexota bacterium]|nr:hypothetical protein [Dehalococcoidia bacterium]MDW8046541.1 hypothetical protein [Chloroflexota bacterium]
MRDDRPERVYGILVRQGRAFLLRRGDTYGLPGGEFRPLAEDRKVELRGHLLDQLGIVARTIWAQGAFDYQAPGEDRPRFSGFYTVWEWEGDVPADAGRWVSAAELDDVTLPTSLRILLLSVLTMQALRTT